MPQEFLASFAVDIDEGGVTRLQTILQENREKAEQLAAAFDAARGAMEAFASSASEELTGLNSLMAETFGDEKTFSVSADFSAARTQFDTFLAYCRNRMKITADASGVVQAATDALNEIRSMFNSANLSTTVTVNKVIRETTSSSGSSDSSSSGFLGLIRAATGGRFSSPTRAEIAEDGDPEYVVPVKKEKEALPIIRSLLSELSVSARESLKDYLAPAGEERVTRASVPAVTPPVYSEGSAGDLQRFFLQDVNTDLPSYRDYLYYQVVRGLMSDASPLSDDIGFWRNNWQSSPLYRTGAGNAVERYGLRFDDAVAASFGIDDFGDDPDYDRERLNDYMLGRINREFSDSLLFSGGDESVYSRLLDITRKAKEAAENGEDVSAYADEVKSLMTEPLKKLRDYIDTMDLHDLEPAGEDVQESVRDAKERLLGPVSEEYDRFVKKTKEPISPKLDTSGVQSAAGQALSSIRSLFSSPLTVKVKAEKEGTEGDSDSSGSSGASVTLSGSAVKAATGGRFSSPTHAEIAEDGDPEYVVPVKKENEALPLIRSLLSELSASARESLRDVLPASGGGLQAALAAVPDMMSAASAVVSPVFNQSSSSNVSAPVNIHVEAAAADPESVGRSIYDTAERYLLRTLTDLSAL